MFSNDNITERPIAAEGGYGAAHSALLIPAPSRDMSDFAEKDNRDSREPGDGSDGARMDGGAADSIDSRRIADRRSKNAVRAVAAAVLAALIVYAIIDRRRLDGATTSFLGWVQSNPGLGLLSFIALYTIATGRCTSRNLPRSLYVLVALTFSCVIL